MSAWPLNMRALYKMSLLNTYGRPVEIESQLQLEIFLGFSAQLQHWKDHNYRQKQHSNGENHD